MDPVFLPIFLRGASRTGAVDLQAARENKTICGKHMSCGETSAAGRQFERRDPGVQDPLT